MGGGCVCPVSANCLAIDEADRIFATDYVNYNVKVFDTGGAMIARMNGGGVSRTFSSASQEETAPVAILGARAGERAENLVTTLADIARREALLSPAHSAEESQTAPPLPRRSRFVQDSPARPLLPYAGTFSYTQSSFRFSDHSPGQWKVLSSFCHNTGMINDVGSGSFH